MNKMLLSFFLFIITWATSFANPCTYGIAAQHQGLVPITKFKIFGERHSGTNYLSALMHANFPSIRLPKKAFGWKHGSSWLTGPQNPSIPKINYTFSNSDSFLFIVIFRNPYSWVTSMYSEPYHAIDSIKNLSFSDFLHSKWKTTRPPDSKSVHYHSIIDFDPITQKPFCNIMKLRSAKIANMLKIQERVKNIYYVNYEELCNHPKQVVREIASLFNLRRETSFVPVTEYCDSHHNKNKTYQRPKPVKISPKLCCFINSELDWELEQSLGYTKK